MYRIIYGVVCQVYATVLRPVLKRAIDNPDEEWDELVMSMVDGLFNYTGV